MPPIQYQSSRNDSGANITVFPTYGGKPLNATDTHPNFERIIAAVAASEVIEPDAEQVESIYELFDVAETISKRFEELSERVSVKNGRIYLDADEVENALTAQILRFLDEGVEDWQPLVEFFEKVQSNPNEHSREQLYRWLDRHDFTITPEGDIVGYKGVQRNSEGEGYLSKNAGKAIVNGEEVEGRIPTNPGDVIEMPRSEVNHDPHVGCSTGLHVGTFNYAKQWASGGAMLEVHVNPRDVVSVPTDCSDQKVRCCRYYVSDVIEGEYNSAITPPPLDDDFEEFAEEDDFSI